jgi:stage V sporulation protein D (sporulation-specific penicillin-binding protein)
MQAKIQALLIIFLIVFLGLVVRLSYWQVVMGANLSQKAQGQYNSSTITSAPRGNILASDGSFWVLRNNVWQITANPKLIKDSPEKVAERLSPFLTSDPTNIALLSEETLKIQTLISKKDISWVSLANKVNDGVKKNIQALNMPGINFTQGDGRFYPEASSAAQLLGFVGKEEGGQDIGYFGLEGYYNLPLSGKPGFVGQEKDARGTPILLGGKKEVTAINGVDLITSVDKRIQLSIEKNLEKGIEKYGAISGNAIVMDPYTGEILGMAAYPSFDPADYQNYSNEVFRNPVISDSFEPGSIFKVLVMAAAIDSGVVTPDTKCDICGGPVNVDGYQIETWNSKYHPDSTMTDVIVNSDNVGMTYAGQKIGANTLYDYLQKFGIGSLTGIDLQGESAPSIRKRGTWSNVDLDTTTFGQGIAVTGIQMIRAVSAIANGGYLPTPHVVTQIQGDGWQEKIDIPQNPRIISQKSADETAQMMVAAANLGEAKWTKIPGFTVAAKTGTAQIPVAGHYDSTNTNHSFIGFVPVSHPKFIMLVTLQSPQSSPWAAETAAPLWYSIARDLFPYIGIQPDQ